MWVLFDLFVHLVSWYFQWYVLGLFLFSILIFICGFVMQIMCLMKCFNKLFMSCEVISERIFIWNNDIVMMETEDYCHSECLYIPYIFFHSICCFSCKTCIIICPSLVKYSLYSYRCLLPILSYLISFMSAFSIYPQIIIMLPSCLCCWLCTLYLPVKDLITSNVSFVEHIFSLMHVPLWLLWNHDIHKITKHNIYSE